MDWLMWCVYVSSPSQHQSDCAIFCLRQGTKCFQTVLSLDNCAYVVGTALHTYASGQSRLSFLHSFVLPPSCKFLSFPFLSLIPFLSSPSSLVNELFSLKFLAHSSLLFCLVISDRSFLKSFSPEVDKKTKKKKSFGKRCGSFCCQKSKTQKLHIILYLSHKKQGLSLLSGGITLDFLMTD